MTEEFRIEHDTMGEVRVPAKALYSAQTQRAVENFPISGKGLESTQIAALARIKKAAALANKELGTLDGAIADAIAQAADEVASGRAPAWYGMYRFVLTFIVGASIVASLVGREQISGTLTGEHTIQDKINALIFLQKKEKEEAEARKRAELEDAE